MGSYDLLPQIMLPTRITDNSKTLIDNIFLDSCRFLPISGNLTYHISDHLPQFMLLKNTKINSVKENTYKRNWKMFDQENFIMDFLAINWDDILKTNECNTDLSFDIFYSKINELLDKYVPVTKLNKKQIKNISKPWITSGIQKSICIRNQLHKKFIKEKNPRTKTLIENQYKKYRNLITKLCRQSKKNYFSLFFQKNSKSIRKMWEGINSIISLKNTKSKIPSSIFVNNKISSHTYTIANEFNSYFSSIAESIRQKSTHASKSFKSFLSNSNDKSMFINPTDEKEIICCISSLKENKGSGPYSIPFRILQLLKHDIAKPLAKIINLSFSTGVFPTKLKMAKVIPIFKKDSPLHCSNYRPISLLSNIDKIIEKLMYSRLIQFLNKFKCLFTRQFGFRKNYSTNHTLINITEIIRNALDSGQFACGVFIDFEKAFDTVDHEILLAKLSHYGIRGLANSWLRSYLTLRSQYVSINNSNSELKYLVYGVPQGSVLGPLLFLIYINDLHLSTKFSIVHHFADDTNLLITDKSLKAIRKKINIDLKLLYHWLSSNKISLNTNKTEYVLFHHKSKPINYKLNLKINGKKIYPSKFVKYLGIYLDENLSWKKHINILSKKLTTANGAISKLRHIVPINTLISIYYAIFQSHVFYACQIWGQNLNSITNRIYILQKRAIKLMSFKQRDSHSEPLFYNLKILQFHDMIQCENAFLMHKLLTNQIPPEIKETFKLSLKEQFRSARNTLYKYNVFKLPKTNTSTFGNYSIKYQCILTWHYLSEIFSSLTLSKIPYVLFKQKIKDHYIDLYR